MGTMMLGVPLTTVVFLDIDGVLNTSAYLASHNVSEHAADDWMYWASEINPDQVAILNEIVKARPDVSFVLSSSWRTSFGTIEESTERVQWMLEAQGFLGKIVSATPDLGRPRGQEIAAWLADHQEVTQFVIVDDCDDMLHLNSFLVQTDPHHGITRDQVRQMLRKLTA